MAYQKGDFRGVPFLTRSATTTIGRRSAIFEIPFDDKGAASIDLGRAPRKYQISALLHGEDVETQRDKLIKALESYGVGRLTHPYLGSVNVIIQPNITITEDNDAQHQVEISFQAVESRDPLDALPSISSLGTRASLLGSASALGDALGDAMEAGVSVAGVADFVADANIDLLDNMLDTLRDINGDIDALLAIPGNIASQIDAISAELAELLDTPRKLFDVIDNAMNLVMQAIRRIAPGGTRSSVGSMARAVARSAALGETADPVPADVDTPARTRQRQNHGRLTLNLRANALRRAAEAAADLEFDSADQAKALARGLAEALDAALLAQVEGEELPRQVRARAIQLRAATYAHLSAKAGELIELKIYTPPETAPASAVAYHLYGDATRRNDIVARNESIKNPAFVPGGIPLEVLSE